MERVNFSRDEKKIWPAEAFLYLPGMASNTALQVREQWLPADWEGDPWLGAVGLRHTETGAETLLAFTAAERLAEIAPLLVPPTTLALALRVAVAELQTRHFPVDLWLDPAPAEVQALLEQYQVVYPRRRRTRAEYAPVDDARQLFLYQVYWVKITAAWSRAQQTQIQAALQPLISRPDFIPNLAERQYRLPDLAELGLTEAHAGASLVALSKVLAAQLSLA